MTPAKPRASAKRPARRKRVVVAVADPKLNHAEMVLLLCAATRLDGHLGADQTLSTVFRQIYGITAHAQVKRAIAKLERALREAKP
jgi:hypothetical protein